MGPVQLVGDRTDGLEWAQHSSQGILPMTSDGPALPVENLAHDLQWAQYNLVGDRTDGFEWAQYSSQGTLSMASDWPSVYGGIFGR